MQPNATVPRFSFGVFTCESFQAWVEELTREGVPFGSAVLRARADFGLVIENVGPADIRRAVERSEWSTKAIETSKRLQATASQRRAVSTARTEQVRSHWAGKV